MKLLRRQFLHLSAGAAALPFAPHVARAQAYPARPVRIIAPFPPGGAASLVAHLLSPWLSERLGQPFVVENRPGAVTNIGTEAVVRAPADGYTLLLASLTNTINATLYDKLNFNFIRDIAPVASIMRTPNVMVVNPLFPAKTLPEFIAHAKRIPNKLNFVSADTGVAGELFNIMAGVKLAHVSYPGMASALAELVGGRFEVSFPPLPPAIAFIRDGKLRPLAVTTAMRLEALPDVPTVGEFVPGYEASGWQGIGAPRNTPAEIIDKLNKEINAGLADPKLKARIADLGGTPLLSSPTDFGKLLADETEKWGKVIKTAGIKPV
jgi:tripartite-type tricarboxylate transporter receptor subunit TctC